MGSEDKIVYLKNLHMFEENSWTSIIIIVIKPKAKDLKSVIEVLSQMDYL